ncbi:MAG: hypothetical protein ACTSYF_08240 [Promethearchaeota archaeon]
MSELSEILTSHGVWIEGVYRWSKRNIRINPLEDYLNEFRENTLRNYDYLNEEELNSLVEELCEKISELITQIPDKSTIIQQSLDNLCKDLSKLFKKKEFEITISIENKKGKIINNSSVELSKNFLEWKPDRFKIKNNTAIKLSLQPKLYYLKAKRRFLLFFKREQLIVLPIFSDRKIRINL